MKEYKFLQAALLVSFSIHAATIFGSRILPFLKVPEEEKQIKVTYMKIEKKAKEPLRLKDEPSSRRIPPPFVEPQDAMKEQKVEKPKNLRLNKPELIKPDDVVVKKKITLPAVEMAKVDNPSYISYYQIVREKIRRAAYRGYSRNDTGEVYATFIISNDGLLKNAQIIDEKSSAGTYLRGIAFSSIKAAAPFPNFPKDLDYEELSFNVVISFETE
ncbi:MAG: hypothetical protein FJZ12_03000 [Candidatus Omnitrophica bacterium]|nr:hypothetical protein [Candidatus Omnitrophota bacterium]